MTRRRICAALTAAALGLTSLITPTPSAQAQISSSAYIDELGRPTPMVQQQIRQIALTPWLPKEISNALLTGLNFVANPQPGNDTPLPENGPVFTQFHWPSVSGNCIGGQLDSVGSAIAVRGPAEIPAPGAADGQTTFLFTALGTSAAAAEQDQMHVHWLNLNTWKFGTTPLGNHGINPDGPATISGTADTGHGTVVAAITGAVNTQDATCSFFPTTAVIR